MTTTAKRLAALGYEHRRHDRTENTGTHEILRNGRLIGCMTALDCSRWLDRVESKLSYLRDPLPAPLSCPMPNCGSAPTLWHNGCEWQCNCPQCFDGDPERMQLAGSGTKRQAVRNWNEGCERVAGG